MFARRFRPFITVAVFVAVFSGSPGMRAQDVAEAARKAKAKKQQQHPDAISSPTATKPKSYTNDDFPESGGAGAASPGQDIDRVRSHGDWETWLEFFLTGVKETAQQAADTSKEILTLIEEDRRKIEELGRPAASVLRVHQHFQRKPIITIPATAQQLSLSAPTVAKALQHMVKLSMVRETTGKQRHRLFTYHRYLEILNRGTELPK